MSIGRITTLDGSLYADFLSDNFGLNPYQFARIYSWLDPYSYASDEGMHLITSLNAIGSGEIFGKGYGERLYMSQKIIQTLYLLSLAKSMDL